MFFACGMQQRRMLVLVVTALAALLVSSCGGGEEGKNEEEESQAPSQEEVQSALEQAVAEGIPGIALEIQGPEASEFLTAGSASLEDERPLLPEDRFRIASVTKAFTAAVVMELVEEGALSLDETVEQLAPGLLAEGDSITVRHLLGHTSGLPDYTKDENFLEAFVAGEDLPPERIVSFVASEPLAFEPGTQYEYSDTDNIVLGMIVEAVAGRSYEQELSSRVLDHMELRSTVLPNSPEMPEPHAEGYQYPPESEGAGEPDNVTMALDPSAACASGALVSTPGDVSGFFASLLGGELVGEVTIEQMKETLAGEGDPPDRGRNERVLGSSATDSRVGRSGGTLGSFPATRHLGQRLRTAAGR